MTAKTRTPEPQDIEELKTRHKALSDKRIEAQTELKNAEKTMKDLKAKAKKEYGTDDPEELAAKLEAMKKENEQKRTSYQKSLDQIEADLDKVAEEY